MMKHKVTQKGVATLGIATALLLGTSLITIFMAKSAVYEQKVISNIYQTQTAAEVAQAGLEYGMAYLEKNRDTLLADDDNDGYMDIANTAYFVNAPIKSGYPASDYTITYSNPVASNMDLIYILGKGASTNTTASRTIHQMLYFQPNLSNVPELPVIVKGDVDFSGDAVVTNMESDKTIWSGGTADMAGSSATITSGGGSTPGNIGADIIDEDAAIASITNEDFFKNTFGLPKEQLKEYMRVVDKDTNLDGVVGQSIWVESPTQMVRYNSNDVYGSPTEPVLLIINGDARITGTLVVYGFVYVTGDVDNIGIFNVYGSVSVEGNMGALGTFDIIYDSTVLNLLKMNQGNVAVVPGSWLDL